MLTFASKHYSFIFIDFKYKKFFYSDIKFVFLQESMNLSTNNQAGPGTLSAAVREKLKARLMAIILFDLIETSQTAIN